ncbi:hypothetical protein IE53DRAFT_382936 [Violaceomyces palustris]|uniref:Uncharacterized protein n=1 Tax=Violaceomyces palustris TaxID=1673888 RepID=A0ACD0P8S2_9BASI|nr:hypothetical protein IE53DRAFT_382936 [Violaceomyces palustris]
MKNIPPPTSPGEKKILAFRAITDEMDASGSAIHSNVTSSTAAGTAKRWSMRGARTGTSSDPDDLDDDGNEGAGSTSHQIVDRIVSMMLEQCIEVGACDGKEEEEFLKHETIQGLAEAKANVPLFGPLIEGLKRRLWL